MNPISNNPSPDPAKECFARELLLSDPRLEPDFDPKFFPRADGMAVHGLGSNDRNGRITVEFSAVYYELNRLFAKLTALRERAVDPDFSAQERSVMQEIEQRLRLRDELEDRYAPYGVIAEPVTQEGVTVDIKFTFGNRDIARRQQMQFVSSSALLIFPTPLNPESQGWTKRP